MTARCNITKSFLLKVLDESQQGVHIVDEEGNTLLYNKTAEAIDGMTKKEMISKNMKDLVDCGTFSTSVALDVIKTGEVKEVIQNIKDKTVVATEIPIYNKKKLKDEVEFSKDSKMLEVMVIQM